MGPSRGWHDGGGNRRCQGVKEGAQEAGRWCGALAKPECVSERASPAAVSAPRWGLADLPCLVACSSSPHGVTVRTHPGADELKEVKFPVIKTASCSRQMALLVLTSVKKTRDPWRQGEQGGCQRKSIPPSLAFQITASNLWGFGRSHPRYH